MQRQKETWGAWAGTGGHRLWAARGLAEYRRSIGSGKEGRALKPVIHPESGAD